MACVGARADDAACRFVEWGYSYFQVKQQGETWTYLLTATSSDWRNVPYGWHAPGSLTCQGCSSGPMRGGLYYFLAQADRNANEARGSPKMPATAAERAKQQQASWGYPSLTFGADRLEHIGSRDGISVGPLSGYAVHYRLLPKQLGSDSHVFDLAIEKLAEEGHGLLVIHLTDGCVSFDTTFMTELGRDANIWRYLDSFLTGITITKNRGAERGPAAPPGTGYSGIVRARPKGEEPK
jgi:hypothetical protein